MHARDWTWLLLGAAVIAALPAAAQTPASPPDFSGPWGRNAFDFEQPPGAPRIIANIKRLPSGLGDPNQLVGDYKNPLLRPEASDIVKIQGDVSISGNAFPDPSNHCSPYSPPFAFAMQLGLEMLQAKDQITILYNQDDQVRRIRMNSAHPAKVTPSAMGDSVGHYEGDTLVIDTVGVKVGPVTMMDRYGTPQSDAMHVVERYRLIEADAARIAQETHEKKEGRVGAMQIDPNYSKGLRLDFTIDDPKIFTQPWSAQVTYRKTRGEWAEQVCAENFYEYYYGKPASIPKALAPEF